MHPHAGKQRIPVATSNPRCPKLLQHLYNAHTQDVPGPHEAGCSCYNTLQMVREMTVVDGDSKAEELLQQLPPVASCRQTLTGTPHPSNLLTLMTTGPPPIHEELL